ncbi:hypothetical protein ACFTUC_41580, partial [Streptomyces sp. NPDC056944]|uniref:hypothetical protein n=1 Tax=Streptomyces sp. NPDC056944 TaxID=3345972 RepID=UPI00363ACC67
LTTEQRRAIVRGATRRILSDAIEEENAFRAVAGLTPIDPAAEDDTEEGITKRIAVSIDQYIDDLPGNPYATEIDTADMAENIARSLGLIR